MSDRSPLEAGRRERDAYYTPDDVAFECVRRITPYLRDHRYPSPLVIEPSVGGGAFIRALHAIGVDRTLGVDVDPNAAGLLISRTAIRSTFESVQLDSCDRDRAVWVVGNPPFKHALEHVEHALSLAFAMRANPTLPAGGVGFLLRLAFLEGKARRRFWDRYPVTDLHVLSERPSFTGGKTDSCAYGFFVWRDAPREPVRWL